MLKKGWRQLQTNSVNNRWIINRIGLINFWYYDEEEFYFLDGRLLLRGANGSGKSVTMQSFIPLLLDGNKSPERLDPFGSRARKLENYLLGEDEQAQDERTGYLYMEFLKPAAGNYITIGMGLKARRGKPLDFWGFALTDGRRIGKDFLLYKDVGEKIPLSKIELRNRIAAGGEIHESQGEYMAMVNRLLFGFENIDDYDELIKLLVQLRTPKLSKEFKPSVVYEIMNNSLQPLSDEDLRPMSEAIENMDKIKTQLEVLRESKKAAERLKVEYDRYNRFVLHEKAKDFLNSQEKLDRVIKDIEKLEQEKNEYNKLHLDAEQQHENLKLLQINLEHRKTELEQCDSFKAKQELQKIEDILRELNKIRQSKNENLDNKKRRQRQLDSNLGNAVAEKQEQEENILCLLEEMSSLADDIYFDEHDFAKKELKNNLYKKYDFEYIKAGIAEYKHKIVNIRKTLEQQRNQEKVYDETLKDLDAARKDKDEAKRELEKAESLFEESKEEFIEKAYIWEKSNVELRLGNEILQSISRIIGSYGVSAGFDDIVDEVRKQYNVTREMIIRNRLEAESGKAQQVQMLEQKKKELEEWKNKKDPEPPRENKSVLNRQRLQQLGVPFIPLYKAVDFCEDIQDDIKGRIEEALMDMGLLDALIVPAKYESMLMPEQEQCGDRYLFAKPHFFRHELSLILKPVVNEGIGVTCEDIENVLKSIVLDDQNEHTSINEKGQYRIGIIKGKASGNEPARFIGAEARKKYRQEIISKIEEEIEHIKTFINAYDEKIRELNSRISTLEKEYKSFPDKKDIETALNILNQARIVLQAREKDVDKKQDICDRVHKELKDIKERVRKLTEKMQLPLSLEAYEQAEKDASEYRDMLGVLEMKQARLIHLINQISAIEEQLEEISYDIENILYDIRDIDKNIQQNEDKKRNYEEVLKQSDYENIKKEIDECIKGLKEIPEKIELAIRNASIYRERYKDALQKLENLKREAIFLQNLNNCCKEGFRKEYGLGYCVKYEEQDIVKVAKIILREFKTEEKSNKLREDYATALQNKYHENRQYLSEYNLIMEYIFDANEFEQEINDAEIMLQNQQSYYADNGIDKENPYAEKIQKVLATQKRLELSARIQGRNVNFFTLVDFIEESIAENERLLKESDRQMFEDILANTVGKKIRAKIYHSEQWVKKMNTLMESMNTSSGLSFSLTWKSRAAETEEQMDTRELIEILKTDAGLLTEEQLNSLTAHFRSKIARARKQIEDTGNMQSFHSIMKEILDYRKWFEFQLFYKKTGQNKKELTDNAFFKFSGGEKAMAMYVPLFSSVYAKYEGARKDCPRIISLDEAFAGVDENNIRDMFRLLEELKLNFIINSQILWGDYDTVPSLSIYELVRPNNADFVTVIKYRWNGKVKELVENNVEDEYNASSDIMSTAHSLAFDEVAASIGH